MELAQYALGLLRPVDNLGTTAVMPIKSRHAFLIEAGYQAGYRVSRTTTRLLGRLRKRGSLRNCKKLLCASNAVGGGVARTGVGF
jgi:hypothetical protein